MKTVDIQQTSLDACVTDARSDRVVITRGGSPVACVGVEGLDEEQVQLGASDAFWKLISDAAESRSSIALPWKRRWKARTPCSNRGGTLRVRSAADSLRRQRVLPLRRRTLPTKRHSLIKSRTVIPAGIIGSTCSW